MRTPKFSLLYPTFTAFDVLKTMSKGRDYPEDILLGLVFSMDPAKVNWNPAARVKLISVFTDNKFHIEGDCKRETSSRKECKSARTRKGEKRTGRVVKQIHRKYKLE